MAIPLKYRDLYKGRVIIEVVVTRSNTIYLEKIIITEMNFVGNDGINYSEPFTWVEVRAYDDDYDNKLGRPQIRSYKDLGVAKDGKFSNEHRCFDESDEEELKAFVGDNDFHKFFLYTKMIGLVKNQIQAGEIYYRNVEISRNYVDLFLSRKRFGCTSIFDRFYNSYWK
jgi:hypothetical protein